MSSHPSQIAVTLRYGARANIALEMPADALVADFDLPSRAPQADVSTAVRAAISQPLDFPPLVQAVVPGDRVVLALGEGVPQAPTIVAEIIDCLSAGGVEPQDFTILRTQSDVRAGGPEPQSLLPQAVRQRLNTHVHDPCDRDHLSYLAAAGRDHEPVYLNRALCEADLVVPIGCLSREDCEGALGPRAGVFPTFSDAASIDRAAMTRLRDATRSPDKALPRRRDDEVDWLLGVQFTLQIMPGSGDDVLEVLAGRPEAVYDRGRQLYRDAWGFHAPRRAGLVVAAISGGRQRQSWDHVARAIAAARRVVRDGGAIAVCSELEEEPGPGLARLSSARVRDSVVRSIRKHRPHDAAVALEIAAAQRQSSLYLLSRLDEPTVEELGITPLGDPRQLKRLVSRHDACIVMADAQFVEASAADD